MPGKPFAFELHRADISQRRVQPGFVVPKQPRDRFILGLAPGHEALPVQALDLERAEQRFAAGIVPAVATPAHRTRNAVLLEHIPEGATGVLAALVAVKQQPGVLARVAPESGHAQRVDNDVRRHVIPQRPAHHLAAEQVTDHSQVKPALISGDVHDVADPGFIGLGYAELAVEQVWRNRQLVIAVGGDLGTPLATGTDTVQLHELLHSLLFQLSTTRHRLELRCRTLRGDASI